MGALRAAAGRRAGGARGAAAGPRTGGARAAAPPGRRAAGLQPGAAGHALPRWAVNGVGAGCALGGSPPPAVCLPQPPSAAEHCATHPRGSLPADPDLYCFDERAVGGAVRPHHPPHRSLKWMCRCRAERLRFRLDPEHLAAAGGGAGRLPRGARGVAVWRRTDAWQIACERAALMPATFVPHHHPHHAPLPSRRRARCGCASAPRGVSVPPRAALFDGGAAGWRHRHRRPPGRLHAPLMTGHCVTILTSLLPWPGCCVLSYHCNQI